MKNKNEVTGNLLLGCTVLRITREFPGATAIFLLEHAACHSVQPLDDAGLMTTLTLYV